MVKLRQVTEAKQPYFSLNDGQKAALHNAESEI
jgi:hypothetical protein